MDGRSFGRRLQALRRERGLTQEQLAELIDRSVDTISNIERGIAQPSYETLRRIADGFGISLGNLTAAPHEGAEEVDPERTRLIATATQILSGMDVPALRLAVAQLQVLARHLKRLR